MKIILRHIEKNICSLLLSAAQIPSVDRSGCCNALTCPCNACHAGVPVAEYCKDETWRGKNSYGKMFTILSLRIYKYKSKISQINVLKIINNDF